MTTLIDIIGGSYEQLYKEYNAEKTINWYYVQGTPKEKPKSPAALFPFPGLTKFVTLPGRYYRGGIIINTPDQSGFYVVVDNILYQVFNNRSYNIIGTLNTLAVGSSFVYMTIDRNDNLFIGHSSGCYVYNCSTQVLSNSFNSQFPGSASDVDFVDGYTFIVSNGTVYFCTPNNSLTGWLSLQTLAPTFTSDPAIACRTLRDNIYIWTKNTLDTYINDGVTPWSRYPQSTIYIGLEAKDTLAKWDAGFIFLGRRKKGKTGVFYFDDYFTCKEVTPFSLAAFINSNPTTDLSECYGDIQYSKDGHLFYYLTIPCLKTTYVYDLLTQQWVNRESLAPFQDVNGDFEFREFRGKQVNSFGTYNIWGDIYSGNLYYEDRMSRTDDSLYTKRVRIAQNYNEMYKNIEINQLEIDCNTGYGETNLALNPNLQLDISTDQGYSYQQHYDIPLGLVGKRHTRARVMSLGTSRNWTFKLTLTDLTDLIIQKAIASGQIGDS